MRLALWGVSAGVLVAAASWSALAAAQDAEPSEDASARKLEYPEPSSRFRGSFAASAGYCVREDPRVSTENPMFERIEQPGIGRYLVPGSPLDFSAAPRGTVPRAPILGEHTDEILLGVLKLSEREVGGLHDKGLVGGTAASA